MANTVLKALFPSEKFNTEQWDQNEQYFGSRKVAATFLEKYAKDKLAALDYLVEEHKLHFNKANLFQVADKLVPRKEGFTVEGHHQEFEDKFKIRQAIRKHYNDRKDDLLWQYVLLRVYDLVHCRHYYHDHFVVAKLQDVWFNKRVLELSAKKAKAKAKKAEPNVESGFIDHGRR